MDLISLFFDFILHIDKHLATIIDGFGPWTYAILFAIIFIETGVVIAPYLPGDSLIFAVGAFAAIGAFNLPIILILLILAAILGDSLNYATGKYFGPKVFSRNYKWLDRKALDKSKKFFDTHGAKTIILARFVPILRTFAPFIAGVSNMQYRKFLTYNVVGGALWVSLFMFAGYFFGNLPFVKDNFSLVVIGIIIVSLVPVIIELVKYYKELSEQNKEKRKAIKDKQP
jgi:membrane-associated protein